MLVYLFQVSFCKLIVEVFHQDFWFSSCQHFWDFANVLTVVDIDAKHTLDNVKFTVIQSFSFLAHHIRAPEILKQESDFESLTGQSFVDDFEEFNVIADVIEVLIFLGGRFQQLAEDKLKVIGVFLEE